MPLEYSEILELSPLGITITNTDQRIEWCNSKFLQDFELQESDIINQLYASLPIEAVDNKAHLVQQFDDSSKYTKQYRYWLAISGDKTIHYFALVRSSTTKLELLQAAKLPKRPSWVEFLDYEVSRSRRYGNPLSVLKLQVVVDNQPQGIDDKSINQVVKDALMDELRWADMIGNTNTGSFLVVLPETPANTIDLLIQKLTSAISTELKALSKDIRSQTLFGFSVWQKHDDSNKLLARARLNLVDALEKALNKP